MTVQTCTRCNGSGYANAARDSGRENAPLLIRPIGVYHCTTCGGSGKIGFDEKEFKAMLDKALVLTNRFKVMLDKALVLTNRRVRVCKQAPHCHKCGTSQVQIMDCSPLATWKCRHCHHTWQQEPLVVENYLPDVLVER